MAQPHNVYSFWQPGQYYSSGNNYALIGKSGCAPLMEFMGICSLWGKAIWAALTFISQNSFAVLNIFKQVSLLSEL